MATYKTPAIIIGRYNFGEADRIIVLLTPERGVIRAVAKGVRRIKSRLAGHLELFSESELMLAEGKSLDTITSARLQKHISIGDNYALMQLTYLIAEMTAKLSGEDEHPGLFELVHDALTSAQENPDNVTELWFKLRLLDHLGYRPELDACIVCGISNVGMEYRFDAERGGIVDLRHATAISEPITHQQIKFWRLLLGQPMTVVRRVPNATELTHQTMSLANLFYDYTFSQRFRSTEALE